MTTFPTLDPELAAALTMVPKLDFADLPNARATYDALVGTMLADLSFDGVTLRELSAPGLDGDPEVTIRFFTPDNTAGPVPVLLWIHGGGFAIGTAESSDLFCVEVARELGFAVANVEYRLAPETPFPGPVNDCYAALLYIHAHAEKLGVDPSRIAVGGQSAGGGLAAGTVLKARDEGVVPVAFQFLDIPALDDRLATVSMTNFVDTPLWHRPNAILSWKYYLASRIPVPNILTSPFTLRRPGLPTSQVCRRPTCPPWNSTRSATKESNTPFGCCKRESASNCTPSPEPFTGRHSSRPQRSAKGVPPKPSLRSGEGCVRRHQSRSVARCKD